MSEHSAIHVWPIPHRVRTLGGTCELRRGTTPELGPGPGDPRVERAVRGAFAPLAPEVDSPLPVGRPLRGGRSIRVELRAAPASALRAGGYRLSLDTDGVGIEAPDAEGQFRAASTLAQLVRGAVRSAPDAEEWLLPRVAIEDEPDFPERGFMLDVSRDRVPRMDALLVLVDRLAELKYNRLQLYMEHTFAYAGHEEVWKDTSPFTPDEIRTLDAFCGERFIELVPNQQSFGHMHRWLVHPRYRELAEVPEGIEHAFSVAKEPFSLAAGDPRTFALLEDLFDQLMACFTSDTINVGMDETFDLGLGASRAACAARGTGTVYLEYLEGVHEIVRARGKRMQFWGDVIVNHPDLVPRLPADAVALEWGYEAGHPFEKHAARFAASGLEFHVCPGTSSWQSFAGRLGNARANLEEAARHGLAAGARGYLVTDWGDFGHWQPPSVSWPGILIGASRAWNAGAEPAELARGYAHVVEDPGGALLRAQVVLAEAYRAFEPASQNGSPLFFLLRYAHQPLPIERAPGLNAHGLERHAEKVAEARDLLASSGPLTAASELVRAELTWVCDILDWSAGLAAARLRAGTGTHMGDVPANERKRLAAELGPLVERHRALWLQSSRPGGLRESAARFEHLGEVLRGDRA